MNVFSSKKKKKKKDGTHMTFCDIALEVTSAYSVGQSCQKVTQIQVEKNRPHTLVMVTAMGGECQRIPGILYLLLKKTLNIYF